MSDESKAAAAAETLEAIRKGKSQDTLCLITAAYADGVKAGQQLEQMKREKETA